MLGNGHGDGNGAGVPLEHHPLHDVEPLVIVRPIPSCDLELGPKIAEGASSVVLRAKWRGTPVAAKIPKVKPNAPNIDELNRRIKKEVHIGLTKGHGNLVQTFGFCQELSCIVMEHLPNGSVRDMIQSRRREALDIVWRLKAAEDVASAADCLHQPPEYIHGDIKSSNAFSALHGIVKLGDFDRSRSLAQLEHDIAVNAKEPADLNLFNHAPEVIRAHDNDRSCGFSLKSDVYSFGLFLQEVLDFKPHYGLPSYDYLTVFNALSDISVGRLTPTIDKDRCRSIGKWYPCAEAVFEIFDACVKFDPQDRPDFSVIYDRLKGVREAVEAAIAEEKQHTTASIPQSKDSLCTRRCATLITLLLTALAIVFLMSFIKEGGNWMAIAASIVLVVAALGVVCHHIPVSNRDQARSCLINCGSALRDCVRASGARHDEENVQPLHSILKALPPPSCWPELRKGLLKELPSKSKDLKAKTVRQFCQQHKEEALSVEDWLELKETVFRSTSVLNTTAWRRYERESKIHDFAIDTFSSIAGPSTPASSSVFVRQHNGAEGDNDRREIESGIKDIP